MKAEMYALDTKIGEATFNEFEYTLSGEYTELEEFLQTMEKKNGPQIRGGGKVINEEGGMDLEEYTVADPMKKAQAFKDQLDIMFGCRVEIVE
jgi:hypothetical protein